MLRHPAHYGVQRRRLVHLAFGVPAFAGLLVVLVFVLSPLLQGENQHLVILSLGAIGLMGLCTWLGKASKSLDFFEPLVVVFGIFLIFYPFRLIFAVVVGIDDYLYSLPTATLKLALFASSAGFLAFAAGYRSMVGRWVGHRIARALSRFDGEWNIQRTTVVSLVFLSIGLGSLFLLYLLRGSILDFLVVDPVYKARYRLPYWYSYLGWGVTFLGIGLLFQVVVFFRYRRQGLYTMLYFLGALLVVLLVGRYHGIALLFMVAGMINYVYGKVRVGQLMLLGALMATLLVLGGLLRESVSPGVTTASVRSLSKALTYHVLAAFDHLTGLALVIELVPQALPLQWGSTFLGVPLKALPHGVVSPFPRAQILVNEALFPGRYETGSAMAATMLGEWYLNFSWVGIVLGMALVGMIARALWALKGEKLFPGRVLIYMISLFGLVSWVRNDVQVASTIFLLYFLPALLGLLFVTRSRPRGGER